MGQRASSLLFRFPLCCGSVHCRTLNLFSVFKGKWSFVEGCSCLTKKLEAKLPACSWCQTSPPEGKEAEKVGSLSLNVLLGQSPMKKGNNQYQLFTFVSNWRASGFSSMNLTTSKHEQRRNRGDTSTACWATALSSSSSLLSFQS